MMLKIDKFERLNAFDTDLLGSGFSVISFEYGNIAPAGGNVPVYSRRCY